MKNYFLRDIPEDLWKKVKSAVALNDTNVRAILVKSLENYIKENKGEKYDCRKI